MFYNISTYDADSLINELKNKKLNIEGILTRATGQPVVTASKVAQAFELKALDLDNSLLFSNKSLLILSQT